MGLGFVLFFWGVAGLIAATVGSFILALVARCFVDFRTKIGRRAILLTGAFPFICLAWAGGVFVTYAIINDLVFHRDPGIGDGFYCPLPNGYRLDMIDVTTRGTIYNPKTQSSWGGTTDQDDTVSDALAAQISGRYILVGTGGGHDLPADEEEKCCDLYYLLDTKNGQRTRFSDYNSLRDAAFKIGVQPSLEKISNVYAKYRATWFDVVGALALFGGPLLGAFLLLRWIMRIRKMAPG